MPGRLILMCGLPCSGKTTLAKQLEHEQQALRLTVDEWIEPLFGDQHLTDAERPLADIDRVHNAVESVMITVAQRAIALGLTVILDFGVWSREDRVFHRDWATRLGASCEIVALTPPLAVLLERLEARNASLPANTYRISSERLVSWHGAFEAPTEAELSGVGAVAEPECRRS